MKNDDLIKGIVFVEVTNACNYHCQHCYLGQLPSFSDDNTHLVNILNVLSTMRTIPIKEIRFTGGEPLLAPALPKLIEYCQSENLQYTVVSNGSGIGRITAKVMNIYRPRLIWLSVYGDTLETHDKITRLPGSLRRLQNLALRLRQDGIQYGAHVVVWPPLVDKMDRVLDFAFYDLNVSEAKCIPIQLSGSAKLAEDRLALNDSEIQTVQSSIRSWCSRNVGRRVRLSSILVRSAPRQYGCMFHERVFLTINHKGEISPCCLLMHDTPWLFNTTDGALAAARGVSGGRLPCATGELGMCPLLLEEVLI